MIATFDTETAGLFGPIRLMGYYHAGEYHETTNAKTWWQYAKNAVIDDDNSPVWYAHNLDFDLAKIYEAVPESRKDIDWHSSIQINMRMVRVVFKCGIVLQDSLALLPGSLDNVLKSWGTEVGKLDVAEFAREGGYTSKDQYFCRVPVTDKKYREYLHNDVMGLYEVLYRLYKFTGLTEPEFCNRLTTASLAMKLYQSWYPREYKALAKTHWTAESDKGFRRAFYGGRTEVYRTRTEDAYHYDVNSLYPFVMGQNSYPFGYPDTATGLQASLMWGMFLPDWIGNRSYESCIVTALVRVPKGLQIPPLPVRHKGRLIFPTGKVKGTWCGCELENAIKHGCKVLKVIDIAAWRHSSSYFSGWVEKMSERKCNAKGAEREFYKLLQNSLYGKFAQRRVQLDVAEWTPEVDKKLHKKKSKHHVRVTPVGMLVDFEVNRYASHMQPHIAAHITAYARIVLYEAIALAQDSGNVVIYCDTDSLVLKEAMPLDLVDPNAYGKWKLEREVKHGAFVSPKLYAEIGTDGKVILKAKGLLKSYRDTLSFESYLIILERLASGETIVPLYSGVPNRRRFLRSLLGNLDPEKPRMESKSVHSDTWQKRKMDYRTGDTLAWDLQELTRLTTKHPYEGIL